MMAKQKQPYNKQFSFEKDYPNLTKTRKRPRKSKQKKMNFPDMTLRKSRRVWYHSE